MVEEIDPDQESDLTAAVEVPIETIDKDQAGIEIVPLVIEEVPVGIIEVVVIEDRAVQIEGDPEVILEVKALTDIREAEVREDLREIGAVPPLIADEV